MKIATTEDLRALMAIESAYGYHDAAELFRACAHMEDPSVITDAQLVDWKRGRGKKKKSGSAANN